MLLTEVERLKESIHTISHYIDAAGGEDGGYASLKLAELKALCVDRGLKQSGKKAELIMRLNDPHNMENMSKEGKRKYYEKMTVKELKGLCKVLGTKTTGNKSQLIEYVLNPNKRENRPTPRGIWMF